MAKVEVYNSSDRKVFEGSERQFAIWAKAFGLNDSDKIIRRAK